jgi:hypothetical protein
MSLCIVVTLPFVLIHVAGFFLKLFQFRLCLFHALGGNPEYHKITLKRKSRATIQARAAELFIADYSGLLGSGVGHFFLVRFPGGFIANKKLSRYDFFLTGSYAECMAIWNLGAAKRLFIITHDSISPWVKKGWLKLGSM